MVAITDEAIKSGSSISRAETVQDLCMGEIEVCALRNVDLEIYEREFVVLLGPSGSGKSTLLNTLGGLDPPTSGYATWREHNLVTADEAELARYRREHVGFVFKFCGLIPSLLRQLVEKIAFTSFYHWRDACY